MSQENQTRVVRIEALDSDPGDAIRSYAIAGGADGALFSIVAHTGVLSFREPPNFEAPADVGSTDPPSKSRGQRIHRGGARGERALSRGTGPWSRRSPCGSVDADTGESRRRRRRRV